MQGGLPARPPVCLPVCISLAVLPECRDRRAQSCRCRPRPPPCSSLRRACFSSWRWSWGGCRGLTLLRGWIRSPTVDPFCPAREGKEGNVQSHARSRRPPATATPTHGVGNGDHNALVRVFFLLLLSVGVIAGRAVQRCREGVESLLALLNLRCRLGLVDLNDRVQELARRCRRRVGQLRSLGREGNNVGAVRHRPRTQRRAERRPLPTAYRELLGEGAAATFKVVAAVACPLLQEFVQNVLEVRRWRC